jgi:hypothetical protein
VENNTPLWGVESIRTGKPVSLPRHFSHGRNQNREKPTVFAPYSSFQPSWFNSLFILSSFYRKIIFLGKVFFLKTMNFFQIPPKPTDVLAKEKPWEGINKQDYQTKSELIMAKNLIVWIMTLYSLGALAASVAQVFSGEKSVYAEYPTDQCSYLYKRTKTSYDSGIFGNTTEVMYGYISGTYSSYICTDASLDEVTNEIHGTYITYWDAEDMIGCDPSDPDEYTYIIDNCEPKDTTFNCTEIINTSPVPNGFIWRYATLQLDGKGKCAAQYRDFTEDIKGKGKWKPCTNSNVYYFREENQVIGILLAIVLAIEIVVAGALLFARGDPGRSQGLLGFAYYKFDFPKYLVGKDLCRCMIASTIVTIIVTTLTIAPCNADRKVYLIGLVIFKGLLLILDVYYYIIYFVFK